MKSKIIMIMFMISASLAGCLESQLSTTSPSTDASSSPVPTITLTLPVPTSTATHTPSPTAVPTMFPEQAQATILGWLKNNGDCLLPCVWGLEPERTTTQMRINLLSPFGNVEGEDFGIGRTSDDENPGGIGYSYQSDKTHYLTISLDYYEENGYVTNLTLLTDVFNNDIRIFDDADYKDLTQNYGVAQILATYGRPSHIYLATWPKDPFARRDYQPFIIVLIYTEIGFRAEYVFEAEKLNDQIIGCPTESVLTITTWHPKENMSLKDIASIGIGYEFNDISYEFFKPIDEATTFNIESFYQSYATGNQDCIATPAEIWYSGLP